MQTQPASSTDTSGSRQAELSVRLRRVEQLARILSVEPRTLNDALQAARVIGAMENHPTDLPSRQ